MHPRVVLIAERDSSITNSVWDALDSSGCWIISASYYKLWLLEEQLKLAHAVVIVVERWLTPTNEDKQFRLLIETVQKHHAERPELQPILLVDHNLDSRVQPEGFTIIPFVQAPSPENLKLIVESIKENLPPSRSDAEAGPGLAELVEQADLQRERLVLIISRSTFWPIVGIAVAIIITGLGVALSIPEVLSRFGRSNAWLSIGPVIFVAGAITTIYLILRQRRERARRHIASFLAYRLKEVINEINASRATKKTLIETKDAPA